MRNLIDWLIQMEAVAAAFYKDAAALFQNDKGLHDFLAHLAMDEEWHLSLMTKALACLESKKNCHSIISLDSDTKQRLELPFIKCGKDLKSARLTRDELIECIILTEFSEWNNIFLYAINSLKGCDGEFISAAVKIQQHKRLVERFFESDPELRANLQKINHMPSVWEESLLVVDDTEIIVDLLKAVLADEGLVDSAANGKEALEKIARKYYGVIISDVDMPVMGGLDFYKEAVKLHPNIKERIIFFTGAEDEARASFFRDNGLKYLIKPAPINEIKKAVIAVLNR